VDIQSLLGRMGAGGGQAGGGMPPGMGGGGQGMEAIMPFLMMLLKQMLGQSGAMPQGQAGPPGMGGGMPFASALGAQGGQGMPPGMM
jgi:hypothetical protein